MPAFAIAFVTPNTRRCSPDGRTMIETAVTYDDIGAPQMRTNHFTRIGD